MKQLTLVKTPKRTIMMRPSCGRETGQSYNSDFRNNGAKIFLILGFEMVLKIRNGFAPGFANRLRPKADFGASRGYAGRGRRVDLLQPRKIMPASMRTIRALRAGNLLHHPRRL